MKLKDTAKGFYEQRVPFVAYEYDTGDQRGCGAFRLDETEVHYQRAAVVAGRGTWVPVTTKKRLTPANIRKHFRLIAKTCLAPTWWLFTPGMDYAGEQAYRMAIAEAAPGSKEGALNDLLA